MSGVWEVPPTVCTNFSPGLVGPNAAAAHVAIQPDPETRRARQWTTTLPPRPLLLWVPAWGTAGVAPGLCGEE